MIRSVLVSGMVLILLGCNRSNLAYDKPYFDFDSLVAAQIKLIGLSKDSIRKVSNVDGNTDVSYFLADTAAMQHELEVFRQLDVINKPLFKSSYPLDGDKKDTKSNLLVRTYRFRNTADILSPVPYVRIFFLNDVQRLRRIESTFAQTNLLYGTHRNLVMEFDDTGESVRLRRYTVTGFQKMILSDSVKFSIESNVY